MCGIAGIIHLHHQPIDKLDMYIGVMNNLQKHRGPDDEGGWSHSSQFIGLGHRRLSIIDLGSGQQPMQDQRQNCISYNGEIYNYRELRQELGAHHFKTDSDTEVILLAYQRWGQDCLSHLRGMFAFILWDEEKQTLFCARDRFGIKPLYYTVNDNLLYLSSEVKALLPFVQDIKTNIDGFIDYLAFQFYLDGKTLFKDIFELPPAHSLVFKNGNIKIERYWQVYFQPDFNHTEKYFCEYIEELLSDSVAMHLRSDVPVGAYISGGIDSSIIASLAASKTENLSLHGFTGKFDLGPEYDESQYARELAEFSNLALHEINITSDDFVKYIQKIIYHLDYPIAGPGSFPQFMVSKLVSEHHFKVVLGGQGGDEIFGGYVRYLIAYFEQCIKAAIDGTMNSGNFIVTYESILPNLVSLKNYKPLLKEFWKEGLFEDLDRRYFRLINRYNDQNGEINQDLFGSYSSFESFKNLFKSKNIIKESYFDSMTHFDFKTLLPSLLQVEDRVSMAHGVESRVPFLDGPLVELAATIPSNIKFKQGSMKYALKQAMKNYLPSGILNRSDKMGFPVPINDWFKSELKEFLFDHLSSQPSLNRELVNNQKILNNLEKEGKFNRTTWGFLCFELWQKIFHDKQSEFKKLIID